jgi:hypothetical protein
MSANTISSLAMPALISCLGLVLTEAWYIKMASKPSSIGSTGPALAILDSKTDVIERRPTTRIIWEDLGQGEPLFSGEAVRTSGKASGDITFIKSGMTIKLEPDSLVIIEEADGKLQLNLVNGGVFVKSDDKHGDASKKTESDQPVLKAGNQKIHLSGAKTSEMSLSVSESGSASIQVTKGDVKVGADGGKAETIAEGKTKSVATTAAGPTIFEVQGPRSGTTIPMTGNGDRMTLKWLDPPVGATVFFESGSRRDNLVRQAGGVPATAKVMAGALMAGEFFWRLVAVKDGKIVAMGATNFNTGLALEVPKLISNASNEKIILKEGGTPPEIHLMWTRPQAAEDVSVFVAKDPDFKNIVSSRKFTTETEWVLSVKAPGKLYWLAAAHWAGIEGQRSSTTGSFEVILQKEVPSPILANPADGVVFTKSIIDTEGVLLTWGEQQGVDGYTLTLEQLSGNSFKPVSTKELTTPQFRLTQLPPGSYRWSVQSYIGAEKSKSTVARSVKIIEMPRLTLKDPTIEQRPLIYESETAPISIALSEPPKTATQIRFKVAAEGQDIKALPWQSTQSNKPLQFKVPRVGQYSLLAEAVDQSNKVVAASNIVHFEMKAPDRLPPPALLTGSQPLKTGETGDILLKWKPVPGAVRYIVDIKGKKGNFHKEMPETTLRMNGLFPGDHTLTLTAVDKSGHAGLPSSGVTLSVPDVSSIAAPTSKGIKIR